MDDPDDWSEVDPVGELEARLVADLYVSETESVFDFGHSLSDRELQLVAQRYGFQSTTPRGPQTSNSRVDNALAWMNERGPFVFGESDARRYLVSFDALEPPTEPRARTALALHALDAFLESFRVRLWRALILGVPDLKAAMEAEIEEERVQADLVALGDPDYQERFVRSLESRQEEDGADIVEDDLA